MKNLYIAMILMAFFASCTSGPRISGLNDAMETDVAISSEGYKKPLILAGNMADPYFRGWITKADKSQSHQIYIRVNNGIFGDKQNYNELVYLKDGKPQKLIAKRVGFDVVVNEYGTSWHEEIVVNITREMIDWMTTQEQIKLRLNSSRTTFKMDMKMKGSEAISYLATVQEVLNSLNGKETK